MCVRTLRVCALAHSCPLYLVLVKYESMPCVHHFIGNQYKNKRFMLKLRVYLY